MTNNRLIQYFTLLIYFMSSEAEKLLFGPYILSFWSNLFYPHISNHHMALNLNKQLASHFFYQCLLNCPSNCDQILEHTVIANSKPKKVVFLNRIAMELPLCIVVVDHEDNEMIAYNRQCLHAYYGALRLFK